MIENVVMRLNQALVKDRSAISHLLRDQHIIANKELQDDPHIVVWENNKITPLGLLQGILVDSLDGRTICASLDENDMILGFSLRPRSDFHKGEEV